MSQLSRPLIVRTFMTHGMTDADIAALSTGREAEFERIMAAIRRSRAAAPGALQHVVLYGSRGFGKSFMMRRVEIALGKQPGTPGPVRFLLLPEEQHNLQKSPHALLNYIITLLTQEDGDKAFSEGLFQWPKPGEAVRRWAEAAAQLEVALDAALPGGKGLLVIAVENFDTLLATVFADPEDEQRLRDWLFRPHNRVMLLATATGTVDLDYDRPLFQAFEAVRLTPWTNDDCLAYFNRKRQSEGKPSLDARQEAKARAVAEFIGGTPRLAQLLSDVIDTEDALSVSATMDALADRLADYYLRRIEDLSPLVRGLLDALIRGGEPASQTELAQRVGADGQSQIARAMVDLQRADIIRGRPAIDTRETLYAVTDRVFAHYYRLRQGSRVARTTPLAAILDFLRSFYSRDEQRAHGLRHLIGGRLAEGALLSRLAMERADTPSYAFVRLFGRRLRSYLSAATADFGDAGAMADRLATEPELVLQECQGAGDGTLVDQAIRAVLRAQALFRLGHTNTAEEALQCAEVASRDNIGAWGLCVCEQYIFQLDVRKCREEAIKLGANLIGVDLKTLPKSLECRLTRIMAWSLGLRDRHVQALEAFSYAVQLAREIGDRQQEAVSLNGTGFALGQLDRYAEALEAFSRAVQLAREIGDREEEAASLRGTGWTLGLLERHAEALEALSDAVKVARDIGHRKEEGEVLYYIGWSLGQLDRHAEAVEVLSRAAELSRQLGDDNGLCWTTFTAIYSAAHATTLGISELFAEWVRVVRTSQRSVELDPRHRRIDFLIAATRAGELNGFDAVIAEHGEWLASDGLAFVFQRHGKILADIAAKGGRAAGGDALAHVLPRMAHLQALSPDRLRDPHWLSNLVTGFAQACRDPGLLRDLATLLTPDLSPEAEASAMLLRDLAQVDSANDPERILSRLDPDRALVIRRLRNLPEPEPHRSRKSGRKPQR